MPPDDPPPLSYHAPDPGVPWGPCRVADAAMCLGILSVGSPLLVFVCRGTIKLSVVLAITFSLALLALALGISALIVIRVSAGRRYGIIEACIGLATALLAMTVSILIVGHYIR